MGGSSARLPAVLLGVGTIDRSGLREGRPLGWSDGILVALLEEIVVVVHRDEVVVVGAHLRPVEHILPSLCDSVAQGVDPAPRAVGLQPPG